MLIQYKPNRLKGRKLTLISQANEIIASYMARNYTLTVRQLYYQMVSKNLIANNPNSYRDLVSAVSDGRKVGLIDWAAIVDRTRSLREKYKWDNAKEGMWWLKQVFAIDKWHNQPYRVEVWVEKEALAEIVRIGCDDYSVPRIACRGFMSQTAIHDAALRFTNYIEDGQQVKLIHLGDHDPSGIDMTRDNMERIYKMINHHINLDHCPNSYEVIRLALNMDQIDQYNPPPNFTKLKDSRAAGYIEKYGDDSYELDALDPDILIPMIQEEIGKYVDLDLWDEAIREEDKERKILSRMFLNYQEIKDELQGNSD